MGRWPVAGMVKKKGEPGRTPKIFAPLMRGVGGDGGVRTYPFSYGKSIVRGLAPLTRKRASAQSPWGQAPLPT